MIDGPAVRVDAVLVSVFPALVLVLVLVFLFLVPVPVPVPRASCASPRT
ncbi:hypothetical protein [Plantibacter sp. YIM 135249]